YILRRQGRFEDAIRYHREAVQLDPRSPDLRWELASSLISTRRYEEADRILDGALAIAPDFAAASITKAFVQEAWKGETTLAKKLLGEPRGRPDNRQGRVGRAGVVILLWAIPREALPFLDSVDSDSIRAGSVVYPKALLYALTHEALGDADQARK